MVYTIKSILLLLCFKKLLTSMKCRVCVAVPYYILVTQLLIQQNKKKNSKQSYTINPIETVSLLSVRVKPCIVTP